MRKDGDDLIGPEYTAFQQRDTEDYLSVTWCEYFEGGNDQQLRCAIEAIRSSRNVGGKACFCVALTTDVLGAVQDAGKTGRAVYYPEEDNAAHAGIHGISPDDSLLLAHLAEGVWYSYLTKEAADALPTSACAKSADVV
jgi:hypothetical protein